jgi:catechol 2,3-dioxygenase-like lactoylglutathione lyase family enzyme
MDITIHPSFLPHNDPDASLSFYRDTLGFEARNDVGNGNMHWITVGPSGQPGTSILLATARPQRHLREAASRRSRGRPEPTEQPYGVRDCAVRDPAGNLIRIQELR